MGLRTLSRHDPRYRAHYEGGVLERDTAYHLGTVWPWLMGPFITAYLKVNQRSETARQQCRVLAGRVRRTPDHRVAWATSVKSPTPSTRYTPRGCIAQAWSVAEILRAAVEDVYAYNPRRPKRPSAVLPGPAKSPSLAKAARSSSRLNRPGDSAISPGEELTSASANSAAPPHTVRSQKGTRSRESIRTASSAGPPCPASPPLSHPASIYKSAQDRRPRYRCTASDQA